MDKPKIRFAGASDPGRVRQNNEDALHLDAERGIFLVVDGIGGQAAGEKAAEIAVGRVRARLERQTGTVEQRISEAITMANNEILEAARGNPEWEGMACVLTVAVLENGSAVVGHVGDSRAYQIRGGLIRKITHDHSPVGQREDSGELSEAEAMRHPRRNEVYRDVGSEEHAPDDTDFVELQRIPFEPDSALLLCSDGLTDQVGSKQIQQAVERSAGNPEAAVRELIAAANAAGGKDNVTVLVVEGEQFMAPQLAGTQPRGRWGSARYIALAFATFFLCSWAYAWFLYATRKLPPPPVPPGQILTAGPGQKFSSIAAALAAARPGDTVDVLPGEYHENIRLTNGVTLRSRTPREAVLMGVRMSDVPVVEATDVHNARIAGFRILEDQQGTLQPSRGISVWNSAIEASDMEIAGLGIGVELLDSPDAILLGNSIHDCTDGVIVKGPGTPWIAQNEIRNNKAAGLVAKDGARPAMTGNVFEKNLPDVPADMMQTVKEHNRLLGPFPAVPRKGTTPPARKRE
jgi:serine/threonine protein phosphatase PrpC